MPIPSRTLGLAAALALWLTLPLTAVTAQQADGAQPPHGRGPSLPTVPAEQLQVTTYVTKALPARDLYPVIEEFHGRRFQVEGSAPQQSLWNLQLLGDAVLIYDSPAVTQRILDTLARLDVAQEGASPAGRLMESDLVVAEFTPQYMSIDALQEVLAPFRRSLTVVAGDGQPEKMLTLFTSQQRGTLVARDTPANIAAMRDLVGRLDVAAPHVSVTCLVLRAGEDDDGSVPAELKQHLSELVGMSSFERVTMGLLTTAISPGRDQLELQMPGTAQQGECHLVLRAEAYDASGPSVTFSRIEFMQRGGSAFATRATLRAGEWLVLGAAGAEPLFVVLRLTPA